VDICFVVFGSLSDADILNYDNLSASGPMSYCFVSSSSFIWRWRVVQCSG